VEGTPDVAIVGAGVTGLSIAFHLRERSDASVVVYDRAGVGAGASGVQPGGVRQQWGTRVNCLLARESLAFHRDVAARLGGRVDPGWTPCGYLFLAHSEEALARLRANVELQRGLGVPSELLSPEDAADAAPALDPSSVVGASWCAEDGYFDRPQAVVEAFAEAVRRRGVAIERRDVRSVEGLAEVVVVAAGVGSSELLPDLPIEPEVRFLFLGEEIAERLLEPLVVSAERRFAAKQLAAGRLLASDLGATGDPVEGRERWRASVRAAIRDLLPMLAYVPLPLLVDGIYDVTPDRQAILGAVPGRDGVFVAAGFSGHGFMIAPAVGRLVAGAVLGDPEEEALRDLSPERFATGRLIPEPAVV
jgi:glycine/D-amino acid oxidase-like deaminating enzyme